MARRNKSKKSWLIALGVAALVGLISAGVLFLSGSSDSGFRTTEQLDAESYYNNANSLRGNHYKLEVEIDSALGNSPTQGRLFSVRVLQAGPHDMLPILVPNTLGGLNFQKGQRYLLRVKVGDHGILRVEEARKS